MNRSDENLQLPLPNLMNDWAIFQKTERFRTVP